MRRYIVEAECAALCATLYAGSCEGRFCLPDVPEVSRRVLLYLLEAVKDKLYLLEILEAFGAVGVVSAGYDAPYATLLVGEVGW